MSAIVHCCLDSVQENLLNRPHGGEFALLQVGEQLKLIIGLGGVGDYFVQRDSQNPSGEDDLVAVRLRNFSEKLTGLQ